MKLFKKFFLSMNALSVVLLVLITAMAVATFVESSLGAETAKRIVYEAKWFELLILWFAVILIYNIFRFKLFRKRKWTLLLFHLSFLIILLGAAITRYLGDTGNMHIRENETAGFYLPEDTYLSLSVADKNERIEKKHTVKFASNVKNRFHKTVRINGKKLHIELERLIPNAEEKIIPSAEGKPVIEISTISGNTLKKDYLHQGEILKIKDNLLSFDAAQKADLVFHFDDSLQMASPHSISIDDMSTRALQTIDNGKSITVNLKTLYGVNGFRFVITNFFPQATLSLVRGRNDNQHLDVLAFKLSSDKEQTDLLVSGDQFQKGKPFYAQINGLDVGIAYGTEEKKLPFELKLNDFVLERYPGSMSPSSFISHITLLDKKQDFTHDYSIFMNNVLAYKGYRFYQSSYDTDEKGTILSVNHDKTGTMITYAGYALMILGMLFALFHKGSRFKALFRNLRKTMVVILFIFGFLGIHNSRAAITDSLKIIPKKNAYLFSKVCVQDKGGRIKPLHTYASEAVRKITGKSRFLELTAEQVIFSMIVAPNEWQEVPMIKISNPQVAKLLNISGEKASFKDFFYKDFQQHQNPYKLAEKINIAYRKKPAEQNRFDKDLIKTDEKFSVCYLIYAQDFLRIFPEPDSKNNRWISPRKSTSMSETEKSFVQSTVPLYFNSVLNGQSEEAAAYLKGVHDFQQKYGSEILPSEKKIKWEIIYNRINIFKRLFPFYLAIGVVFTLLLIIHTVNPSFRIKYFQIAAVLLLSIAFLFHTFGLGLRWFVSGHAPWSNGYESMIYVGWVILMAGFAFVKQSPFTLSVTAGLSGLCLLVAHLSWMNPEITNLVPVLKSYWLTIHVAIIIAGYGFLALGCLLGAVCLFLFILSKRKNLDRIIPKVHQLIQINEMSLIVGVYLLTIGTILGGVWANESWGRYWAWDPKEVWALITILVYVFVLHMRFIPAFKNIFSFSFAAFIAFFSVIMTYIGVNYFLSGLHSYAGGESLQISLWVYFVLAAIVIFTISSFVKYRKTSTSF